MEGEGEKEWGGEEEGKKGLVYISPYQLFILLAILSLILISMPIVEFYRYLENLNHKSESVSVWVMVLAKSIGKQILGIF